MKLSIYLSLRLALSVYLSACLSSVLSLLCAGLRIRCWSLRPTFCPPPSRLLLSSLLLSFCFFLLGKFSTPRCMRKEIEESRQRPEALLQPEISRPPNTCTDVDTSFLVSCFLLSFFRCVFLFSLSVACGFSSPPCEREKADDEARRHGASWVLGKLA